MEKFISIRTISGQFLVNPNKVKNVEYWGSDVVWLNYTDGNTDKFYYDSNETAQDSFNLIRNQLT